MEGNLRTMTLDLTRSVELSHHIHRQMPGDGIWSGKNAIREPVQYRKQELQQQRIVDTSNSSFFGKPNFLTESFSENEKKAIDLTTVFVRAFY